jgi:hypothetical protein
LLEETHRRIAKEIAKKLKLGNRETSLLETGSIAPDSWGDFPHHEGKDKEIIQHIINARKLYLENDDECFYELGIALHYIEDKLTLRPRVGEKHTEWENKIERSEILDLLQLEKEVRDANFPTKVENAYLDLLSLLYKGRCDETAGTLKEGRVKRHSENYIDWESLSHIPSLYKAVEWSLVNHPTPTWSSPSIDLGLAFKCCLEVSRLVLSSSEDVTQEKKMLAKFERIERTKEKAFFDAIFPEMSTIMELDAPLHSNCLIYGQEGFGKTETAKAIAYEAVQRYGRRRVNAVTSEKLGYLIWAGLNKKPIQVLIFEDVTLKKIPEEELVDFYRLRHIAQQRGMKKGYILTIITFDDFHSLPKPISSHFDFLLFTTPTNPHDRNFMKMYLNEDIIKELEDLQTKKKVNDKYKEYKAFWFLGGSGFIRTKIVDFEPRKITGWEIVEELYKRALSRPRPTPLRSRLPPSTPAKERAEDEEEEDLGDEEEEGAEHYFDEEEWEEDEWGWE